MGIFGEVSNFQIVALMLLIAAFIFDLTGVAAPYWLRYIIDTSTVKFSLFEGLWLHCVTVEVKTLSSSHTECSAMKYSDNPDWFKAVQAFSCLGFLCLVAALFCSGLKMIITDKKGVSIASICADFAAASFIFLSVVIYGAKESEFTTAPFHFAFAFCIIGMIAASIAGVLTVLDVAQRR